MRQRCRPRRKSIRRGSRTSAGNPFRRSRCGASLLRPRGLRAGARSGVSGKGGTSCRDTAETLGTSCRTARVGRTRRRVRFRHPRRPCPRDRLARSGVVRRSPSPQSPLPTLRTRDARADTSYVPSRARDAAAQDKILRSSRREEASPASPGSAACALPWASRETLPVAPQGTATERATGDEPTAPAGAIRRSAADGNPPIRAPSPGPVAVSRASTSWGHSNPAS